MREVGSLIAGRAVPGAPGGTLEVRNPADLEEVIAVARLGDATTLDRKSTRLNSSH